MSTVEHGPPRDEIDADKVFAALADPHRRTIIAELTQHPPGTEIVCAAFGVPVSKSTRTFHFRVLREAGFTSDVNYGNRKGVLLRKEDIDARFPGLLNVIAHAEAS